MANGWALGKFGGEFGQGTQTYAGAAPARYIWQSLRLGSSNPTLLQSFTCVRLWLLLRHANEH
jgi:hypothetical protein